VNGPLSTPPRRPERPPLGGKPTGRAEADGEGVGNPLTRDKASRALALCGSFDWSRHIRVLSQPVPRSRGI